METLYVLGNPTIITEDNWREQANIQINGTLAANPNTPNYSQLAIFNAFKSAAGVFDIASPDVRNPDGTVSPKTYSAGWLADLTYSGVNGLKQSTGIDVMPTATFINKGTRALFGGIWDSAVAITDKAKDVGDKALTGAGDALKYGVIGAIIIGVGFLAVFAYKELR